MFLSLQLPCVDLLIFPVSKLEFYFLSAVEQVTEGNVTKVSRPGPLLLVLITRLLV